MPNSTVITLQADVKDLKAQLASAEKSAKDTFAAITKGNMAIAESDRQLAAARKEQAAALKPLQDQIDVLNKKIAEGGKLTAKEARELRELNAQKRAQVALNKSANASLEQEISTLKKSNAAKRSALTDVKSEIKYRQQEISGVSKATEARKAHTSALRKEDAERRAMGTTLVRHIRRLESLAVAYFALTRAYNSTFGAGVKLNKQYEDMQLGLSAIIASKTIAIDQYGEEVSAMQKFASAQSFTSGLLDEIKKAAIETPATFGQMVGFYQQAVGHALAANDAFGESLQDISENTIEFTKRMSALGSAAGMSMDRVNEEVRSLISGTASADSMLAQILFGSPANANEAIREAKAQTGGLAKLFDEVFASFDVLNKQPPTFTKQLAQLGAEIEDIQRAGTKELFADIKTATADLTTYLRDNGDEIAESFQNIYQTIKTLTPIVSTAVQAFIGYKAATVGIPAVNKAVAATTTLLGDAMLLTTTKINGTTAALATFNKLSLASKAGILGAIGFGLWEVFNQFKKLLERDLPKGLEGVAAGVGETVDHFAELKKELASAQAELAKMQKAREAHLRNGDTRFIDKAIAKTEAEIAELDKRIAEATKNLKGLTDIQITAYVASLDELVRSGDMDESQYISALEKLQKVSAGFAKTTLDNTKAAKEFTRDLDAERAALEEAVRGFQELYDIEVDLYGTEVDKKLNDITKELVKMAEAGATAAEMMARFQHMSPLRTGAELETTVLGSGLKIDWGDETDAANEVFHDWGDTLNSSISNALVDALTGGDAMAAVEALVASMSASMIQSGVGTLATGDASGLIGIGAGVALSAIGGGLFGSSDSGPTWAERELDRIAEELERQTDILESNQALARALNQTGSAILSGLEMAGDTFVAAMESANIEFDEMFGLALGTYMDDDISGWSEGFTGKLKDYLSNLGVSQEDINSAFAESPLGGGDLLDMGAAQDLINTANDGASAFEMLQAAFDAGIISAEQYQPLLDDITLANEAYATALLENRDTVLSIAQSMSDLYEGITGEDLLGDQMLSDAQAQVSELMQNAGFDSFTDYIADLAMSAYEYGSQIEELSDQLQSEDPADQADAVAALSELTGVYFESTEDALNYMDAITLVGEAMVTSAANIATWQQRNESALETTQRLFSEMFPLDDTTLRSLSEGTQIAQTQEELDALFELLANDMDGLTDAELELLEANQAYIDQMEENTNSMLSWLDSLDGGARFLDEAMAQTGVTSIPSTIEDIQSLYQTFLDGDGIIDQYEQAILDAAAAQVSATEQMQASASDMYEDLYGEKTPAQEMMETMLAMQGQMFVDQFGGLQDVLAMLADGTLDLTEAQWAQVQALVNIEKSTSETAENTGNIDQNTRPDTPYIDEVLKDYRDRRNAERTIDMYGGRYGDMDESDMKDVAALYQVFSEFADLLGDGVSLSDVSQINSVLEALGISGSVTQSGDTYRQLQEIFETETGYTSEQAAAISQLLEAMGILEDSAESVADTLQSTASELSSVAGMFGNIADTAQGFVDSMLANNAGYSGGIYRSYLTEAERLSDVINSGTYTSDDVALLRDAVSNAASYGQSFFASASFANVYDEMFQRGLAANRFRDIQETAAGQEKTINDLYDQFERATQALGDIKTIQEQMRDIQLRIEELNSIGA